MRNARMFLRALGVERAVFEDMEWKDVRGHPSLVVQVRAVKAEARRCPECGRRCAGYDRGDGRRRWRAPDVGLCRVYVEAEAPRVKCVEHGVLVQRVPWSRQGSGFTRAFEDRIAWLAVRTDKSTVSRLSKIAWRTVGDIIARVATSVRREVHPFEGVTRIGIDEVSYRKGHRYLTVVVDHDSGRLLWASPGHDEKTLRQFFDEFGSERSARIRLVSADAARWIGNVVRERCPRATLCLDPFHVVQWANLALDKVRRTLWNRLRRTGQAKRARSFKGARWALCKNPEDLTPKQLATLSALERDNRPIYRAYLLKEQLRVVFQQRDASDAKLLLDAWLPWAARSKLAPFVKLARSIRNHRDAIDNVLEHGLSNARIEAVNTKLRLLTRLAFGFHSHTPLIALALLKLGGLCPPLPVSW